jgi:hypothetical protein
LFFVQVPLDDPAAASVVKTVLLPETLRKPTLVGVDVVADQYLLVTAADGSVLRYALAAQTWTDLGDLRSPAGTALYPVGDIAVVSPQQAWVIAGDEPVNPLVPGEVKQQFLVRFDPLSMHVASVRPLTFPDQRTTSGLLIGLEAGEDGRLTALSQMGDFVGIDAATASVTGVTAVQGMDRFAGSTGGLSVRGGVRHRHRRPGRHGPGRLRRHPHAPRVAGRRRHHRRRLRPRGRRAARRRLPRLQPGAAVARQPPPRRRQRRDPRP